MSGMQHYKACRQDGLPVKLYMQQAMWPHLAPLMLAAFNEAFAALADQAPLADFLLGGAGAGAQAGEAQGLSQGVQAHHPARH
jgi:hypothetical protein